MYVYYSGDKAKNEELNGNYDLRINCAITGCPEGITQKKQSSLDVKQSEALQKITDCIEMLKRCIERKKIPALIAAIIKQ